MFVVRKDSHRENHDPVSAESDILKESMEELKPLLTLMVMLNSVRNRFLNPNLTEEELDNILFRNIYLYI